MNYKNLTHPFNHFFFFWINPVKHWFKKKSLPKNNYYPLNKPKINKINYKFGLRD